MFKSVLTRLKKDEQLIFSVSVRPFIIFCIAVVLIVIINKFFGKLSEDTINGYICCMILNMIITYCNLCYIEYRNIHNTSEDEKK